MGVGGSATAWDNGPSFKENLLRLPNVAAVLILTRDEGSGRVYLGPCGAPFLHYWVSEPDRKSMLEVAPLPRSLSLFQACSGVLPCGRSPRCS